MFYSKRKWWEKKNKRVYRRWLRRLQNIGTANEATTWFSLLRLLCGAVALLQAGASVSSPGNVEAAWIWTYRLVREVTQSSATFLECPPASHGKYSMNGSRYTVCSVWGKCPYINSMVFTGDMVFFKIFGQPFLVLGSVERTYDLFEKRSSKYSDRPHSPMFNELSVAFSLFILGHVHQKAGWITHGTWLSFDTGYSGRVTVVPSMIISIRTSSTSIMRLKSPRPGPFFVACSSLQMTSCSISDSKCALYGNQLNLEISLRIPVHSLRLYSSWLTEWTYLKTMIPTMLRLLKL